MWVIQCYNDTIFSGAADKLIKCWDIKRCECVAVYSGHTGSVFSLAVVEENDTFISGSADKTIRLWNISSQACLRVMWPTHSNPGWVMSLSVSNGHVACAYNNKVVIYHINTGVAVKKFESHTAPVECVQLQMTGASEGILVTSSKDKTIKYWNVADGAHHTLAGHKAAVHGVCYDNTKIISTSSDGTMRIWSFADCPDTSRRKTVIAGGMGEATMYEFSHDENVKYESRETKLYKKHLKKIQTSKNGTGGSSAEEEEEESGDDVEMIERNPHM